VAPPPPPYAHLDARLPVSGQRFPVLASRDRGVSHPMTTSSIAKHRPASLAFGPGPAPEMSRVDEGHFRIRLRAQGRRPPPAAAGRFFSFRQHLLRIERRILADSSVTDRARFAGKPVQNGRTRKRGSRLQQHGSLVLTRMKLWRWGVGISPGKAAADLLLRRETM